MEKPHNNILCIKKTDCKISKVFAECMAVGLGEFALFHQGTVMLSLESAEREHTEGVFDFA